jgi:hypothetical protein
MMKILMSFPTSSNGWARRLFKGHLIHLRFEILFITLLLTFSYETGTYALTDTWTFPDKSYRRELTIPPDPDNARNDVPVFIQLDRIEDMDIHSIQLTPVGSSTAVDVSIYTQPDGSLPMAFWVIEGQVAVGETRYFIIYYNQTGNPVPHTYQWRADNPALTMNISISGSTVRKFNYQIQGDVLDFQRGSRRDIVGQPDDNYHDAQFYQLVNYPGTYMTVLSGGLSLLNGIQLSYALLNEEGEISFNVGDNMFFDQIDFDQTGRTAAFAATYDRIDNPVPHKTVVTHRIFEGLPLMELTMNVTPLDGLPPFRFAPDIYHARQFQWRSEVFNPTEMITDFGEGPVDLDRALKNWVIVTEGASKAMGLFSFQPSSLRAITTKPGLAQVGVLSGEVDARTQTYLAVGTKSELIDLFSTMDRQVEIGQEELPAFNIISPEVGAYFIPGESIEIIVEGPEIGEDLSLTIVYPDQSSVQYGTGGPPGLTNQYSLGTVDTSFQIGIWSLTASSGGVDRYLDINVSSPVHPRILFNPAGLQSKRNLWESTDPEIYDEYKTIFRRLARKALKHLDNPVPNNDEANSSARSYGDNILDYAIVLLMDLDGVIIDSVLFDDAQKDIIRQRMWQDYDRMIRWKNWEPIIENSPVFLDDTIGRALLVQAMMSVYDWHNDDLDVSKKREYADLLIRHAESIVRQGYVSDWPVDVKNYRWVNRNKYFINNAALAMVDRLLKDVVPDARLDYLKSIADTNYLSVTSILAPDGTTNEGMSYNTLGNASLFCWTECLRMNGNDSVYDDNAWFEQAAIYELYGMIPGRDDLPAESEGSNFHGVMPFGNTNSHPFGAHRATMSLLGSRLGSLNAQWIAEESDYDRPGPFLPIWMDYRLDSQPPTMLPNWKHFDERGIFVFRSDWSNSGEYYFSVKSGPMWGGHEHADSGTFVVYRRGMPYIAPTHYRLSPKVTDENIVLANGKGIRGGIEGDPFSTSTDPQYWADMPVAFGSPDYFNVVCNPAPAYEEGSGLTSYLREFVGFDDVIVMRDSIEGASDSDFEMLFHNYRTDPQTAVGESYDHLNKPTKRVFYDTSGVNYAIGSITDTRMRVYPSRDALPNEWMTIDDVSPDTWSTRMARWYAVPGYIPGTLGEGESRQANLNADEYSIGWQIKRTVSGASSAESLLVLSFLDESLVSEVWSSSVADAGVIIHDGDSAGGARIKVVWPTGGNLSGPEAHGLAADGVMAMRHYDSKMFGGRELEHLRDDSAQGEGTDLMSSNYPVNLACHFAGGDRRAWIACDQPVNVTLYHPMELGSSIFNGEPVAIDINGDQVTFMLPAMPQGAQLQTSNQNSVKIWVNYR